MREIINYEIEYCIFKNNLCFESHKKKVSFQPLSYCYLDFLDCHSLSTKQIIKNGLLNIDLADKIWIFCSIPIVGLESLPSSMILMVAKKKERKKKKTQLKSTNKFGFENQIKNDSDIFLQPISSLLNNYSKLVQL